MKILLLCILLQLLSKQKNTPIFTGFDLYEFRLLEISKGIVSWNNTTRVRPNEQF